MIDQWWVILFGSLILIVCQNLLTIHKEWFHPCHCKLGMKEIEKNEEFEKKIHAWAFFDKKSFLEKSKEADDWRLSGKPLGPLHGLPIAIKDSPITLSETL